MRAQLRTAAVALVAFAVGLTVRSVALRDAHQRADSWEAFAIEGGMQVFMENQRDDLEKL